MSFFHDLVEYSFLRTAFVGGILVASLSGLVSPIVVFRRMEFIGDGTAHAVFAGLAAATLIGADHRLIAFATALLFAFAVSLFSRSRISESSAIGILLPFFMAVGVVLFSVSGRYQTDVMGYLFGDVLLVNSTDVAITAVVLALSVILTVVFRWDIKYFIVDEKMARFYGIKTDLIRFLITSFIAITVVTTVKVVGVILTGALLILPGLVSKIFGKSFWSLTTISVIFSTGVFFAGFLTAYTLDLPPGPVIVIIAFVSFLPMLKFS
ncbi:metal ABC transporter permease [Thermotoga maritima MSB8]|uniref:metal ABC transporter permease n=1 Tax=Thermotoga maritima TaxID=2336 RepID=UPI00022D9DC0|nr:metal ABC transporter permease [Thermotoga maritima]AGL49049.1 Zinc ABC transporter, inner membrane permease protein ZnuB [Thermotoga maritima MSB8]AHD18106.1 metal ABC transporter permease [Thermotoga maritima MSB8]AKE26068.1 metal ABC transporter permease [Thermotoga maritima]AKE27931.1 metal ABC transporter permease [Thermotoga maritima MSB8]AKE29804.1 metal ABC transporter permease [Thermotoga maritima]